MDTNWGSRGDTTQSHIEVKVRGRKMFRIRIDRKVIPVSITSFPGLIRAHQEDPLKFWVTSRP